MKQKIYRVRKNGAILAVGTCDECAKKIGMHPGTIKNYARKPRGGYLVDIVQQITNDSEFSAGNIGVAMKARHKDELGLTAEWEL